MRGKWRWYTEGAFGVGGGKDGGCFKAIKDEARGRMHLEVQELLHI